MALDKQNESAAAGKLSGIGGWLILPAIILVLLMIRCVFQAVLDALSFYGDTFKEQVAAHPGLNACTAVSIIVHVGILLYAGYVAYVFFGKRETAPRTYINLLLAWIICCVGLTAWGLAIGLDFETTLRDHDALAAVLGGAIWITYFQRSKRVKATFVVRGSEQEARWFAYGSNVVVALVLAAVVMVAAVWLSGSLLHGRTRSNWASGGSTHLSPRTKALLADLDSNVTLTNLYMEESPEVPNSADMRDMRRQVQNLLTEYADANPSRITVESVDPDVDQAGVEALVGRLRERYKGESEKPKALLAEYQTLQKDAATFLGDQAKKLTAAAEGWKDGPVPAVGALRMLGQRWNQLHTEGAVRAAIINNLVEEQAVPNYTDALTQAKEHLKSMDDNFGAVPDFFGQVLEASKGSSVPEDVKAILTGAKDTYGPWQAKFQAFAKKAAEIKTLQLDTIIKELNQGQAILIETPTQVKVVGFDDVWLPNPNANPETTTSILQDRLFAGEQAVSSALLGLVKEDKPALIFVTFGGAASEYGGPFAELGERLHKANFIVADWDLARAREMPKPEHMTKAILVLVPPPPSNPRSPAPPPMPENYQAAIDLVKAGTPALILGEPGGLMAPTVPYADLFGLFGVTPQFNAVAVHKMLVDPASGAEQAITQVDLTRYNDHPITRPMAGLPMLFVAASPLLIAKTLPPGVTAESLIDLPAGQDYWADTDVYAATQRKATRDEAKDILGPVPLAVAATRKVGAIEQKAVLFGGHFAEDRITQYESGGRVLFPGSEELFVNSALWVSGEDQLIQVSPQILQARRLGDLGSAGSWLRLAVILGLPLAILALGIIVYYIRRR